MAVDRECDSPKGDVKGIRKVCQLMERCDTHGRSVCWGGGGGGA